MTIDDKNIGDEGYTIIANKDTGKIAMMVMSTKTSIINDVLSQIPITVRNSVKTMSKDLAEGYELVSKTCFVNAEKIADKFHVIKLALESLQAVRIRHRQIELAKERELRNQYKKEGKNLKDLPKPKVFKNGETAKELLARSRYLLFKFEIGWTDTQKERAGILFEQFPEIEEAYEMICSFRTFYNCKIGDKERARGFLNKWYEKVKESDIYEIKNFVYSVEYHEDNILNYFNSGQTNAFAESLNNKIQNFLRSNYGIRDRDFFHFRIRLALS